MSGTDRVRLRCNRCDESEWDVWGDIDANQTSLTPERGDRALRCPSCLGYDAKVVEINGSPVGH